MVWRTRGHIHVVPVTGETPEDRYNTEYRAADMQEACPSFVLGRGVLGPHTSS